MIPDEIPWRKGPLLKPRRIALFSFSGGNVVGIVSGMTDTEVTYLTDLYVIPNYRRQGRGRDLVRQFLDVAKDTAIVLLTSEAVEFYKKLGFQERTAMVWRKK